MRQKWEYMQMFYRTDPGEWKFYELNGVKLYDYKTASEAGADGWELVAATPETDHSYRMLYFKRLVE
jgi:hypothetical protein